MKHEGRKDDCEKIARGRGGRAGSRGELRNFAMCILRLAKRLSEQLSCSYCTYQAAIRSASPSATLSALSYQLPYQLPYPTSSPISYPMGHGQAAFDRLSLAKQLSDEQPEFSPLFGNHTKMCWGGARRRCACCARHGGRGSYRSQGERQLVNQL